MSDVSSKGPDWKVLPKVLHAPIFSFQVAPFKGVTDLLILGENSTVAVAVSDLETETENVSVSSGAVVLEVGVEKPKLFYSHFKSYGEVDLLPFYLDNEIFQNEIFHLCQSQL